MEFKYFPEEYRKVQKPSVDAVISEEKQHLVEKKYQLELKLNQEVSKLRKEVDGKKPQGFFMSLWTGAVFGFGFCFAISFFCCVTGSIFDSFGELLEIWGGVVIAAAPFVGGVLGAIISVIVDILKRPQYKGGVKDMAKQTERFTAECERNIKKAEEESKINEERIIFLYEQDCSRYAQEFEEEVRRRSIELAESELAQTIITEITESFVRKIDSADRAPHIEEIFVPISFDVYKYKIQYSSKTFDFDVLRYRTLKNAAEQEALAKAIAAAIRYNISVQRPNDESGTISVVDIERNYQVESVNINVTYKAKNGNYTEVKNW